MDSKTAQSISDYDNHKDEYDPSTFTNDPFIEFEDTQWGKIAIWTPPSTPYIGKELQVDDGKQIPINVSDRFRILVLREGDASVLLEDSFGEIKKIPMEYAVGFRIQSGQKYGVETNEKVKIIEGSEKNPSPSVSSEKFRAEGHVAVDHSKPWGNEPIFSKKSEGDPIGMKILHIEQDGWLSLQAHSVKVESYYMSYGECDLVMENTSRELIEFPLEYDKGYTTKVGQRHRHKGKTKMDVFEVSSSEDGSTTWRLHDKYARGDQTDEVRKKEREQYTGED